MLCEGTDIHEMALVSLIFMDLRMLRLKLLKMDSVCLLIEQQAYGSERRGE